MLVCVDSLTGRLGAHTLVSPTVLAFLDDLWGLLNRFFCNGVMAKLLDFGFQLFFCKIFPTCSWVTLTCCNFIAWFSSNCGFCSCHSLRNVGGWIRDARGCSWLELVHEGLFSRVFSRCWAAPKTIGNGQKVLWWVWFLRASNRRFGASLLRHRNVLTEFQNRCAIEVWVIRIASQSPPFTTDPSILEWTTRLQWTAAR